MMDLEIFQAICKALSNADDARGKKTTGLDGFGELHRHPSPDCGGHDKCAHQCTLTAGLVGGRMPRGILPWRRL